MPARHDTRSKAKATAAALTVERRDAFPFLKLPTELRIMIYEYVLDLSYALRIVNDPAYRHKLPFGNTHSFDLRSTPGLLLVNQQVSSEALAVLYAQPFTLYRACKPMVIMGCFSLTLLNRLRRVTLDIDVLGPCRTLTRHTPSKSLSSKCLSTRSPTTVSPSNKREWSKTLCFLVNSWRIPHHLGTLNIYLRTDPMNHRESYLSTDGPHNWLNPLKELHNVQRVNVSGELLDGYMEYLQWSMERNSVFIDNYEENLQPFEGLESIEFMQYRNEWMLRADVKAPYKRDCPVILTKSERSC